MEKLKIALLTDDMDYGNALCKCIRNIQPALNISIIENISQALEYDMLILDGIAEYVETIPICRLSDVEVKSDNQIYKYDTVSMVVNGLIEIYENNTGRHISQVIDKGSSLIYTVSATSGGLGASSVAYAMAKDFAMAGKCNVLYFSLGETYEECQFFKSNRGLNIVDLLHKILFTDKSIQVNSYVLKDDYGVSCFNYLGLLNHLNGLDERDYIKFFERILQSGIFDKIIVDVGNSLSNNANYMRKISNVNILLRNSEDINYQLEFINNLDFKMDKVVTVENKRYRGNPKFDEFFETEDKLSEDIDIGIFMDSNSFINRDGFKDVELDGEFGKNIRNLINYIK